VSRAKKRKEQLALAKQYRIRESTAWHETAHAVACEYFDMGVTYVTCEPLVWKGQSYLGYCMTAAEEEGQPFEITTVQGMYALMQSASGSVCEWMRGTMKRGHMDPLDMQEMTEIANQFGFNSKEMQDIYVCTEEFLKWSWDVVEQVAKQLIERGRIEGPEVRRIVRTRMGYIPKENQTEPFQGLVIEPGTEAETREPFRGEKE
jgi:hypothetical protein